MVFEFPGAIKTVLVGLTERNASLRKERFNIGRPCHEQLEMSLRDERNNAFGTGGTVGASNLLMLPMHGRCPLLFGLLPTPAFLDPEVARQAIVGLVTLVVFGLQKPLNQILFKNR